MIMTERMFQETFDSLGKPKKPDLIVEQNKQQFVAYFRSNPKRKAIGHTELEALENLEFLLTQALKPTIKGKSIGESKRKSWFTGKIFARRNQKTSSRPRT